MILFFLVFVLIGSSDYAVGRAGGTKSLLTPRNGVRFLGVSWCSCLMFFKFIQAYAKFITTSICKANKILMSRPYSGLLLATPSQDPLYGTSYCSWIWLSPSTPTIDAVGPDNDISQAVVSPCSKHRCRRHSCWPIGDPLIDGHCRGSLQDCL